MSASLQKTINRVRRPRVQIEYDVETGGSMKKIELPFVVGVMADLSADGAANLPPLAERKFLDIDRDNINDRLKSAAPELNLRVDNTLAGDGSKMGVNLKFKSMDDFSPTEVAKQVEPLRRLLEEREKLDNLLSKMESQKVSEDALEQVIANTEKVKDLAKELGVEPGSEPTKED